MWLIVRSPIAREWFNHKPRLWIRWSISISTNWSNIIVNGNDNGTVKNRKQVIMAGQSIDWVPIRTLSLFCGACYTTRRGHLSMEFDNSQQGPDTYYGKHFGNQRNHCSFQHIYCACPTMHIDCRLILAALVLHTNYTWQGQPSQAVLSVM